LRCHNLAQRWMKLDDLNHELPRTPDAGLNKINKIKQRRSAGLHVWVEAVGYDGDVDGQLMTVDGWYWR